MRSGGQHRGFDCSGTLIGDAAAAASYAASERSSHPLPISPIISACCDECFPLFSTDSMDPCPSSIKEIRSPLISGILLISHRILRWAPRSHIAFRGAAMVPSFQNIDGSSRRLMKAPFQLYFPGFYRPQNSTVRSPARLRITWVAKATPIILSSRESASCHVTICLL